MIDVNNQKHNSKAHQLLLHTFIHMLSEYQANYFVFCCPTEELMYLHLKTHILPQATMTVREGLILKLCLHIRKTYIIAL